MIKPRNQQKETKTSKEAAADLNPAAVETETHQEEDVVETRESSPEVDAADRAAEQAEAAEAASSENEPAQKAMMVPAEAAAGVPSLSTGSRFVTPLDVLKNRMPPVEFGTLPRLKASVGQIMDSDSKQLGTWAIAQAISYNELWVVSPGVSDPTANKLCRFSLDGVNLIQREGYEDDIDTVDAWLTFLKEEKSYEKARKAKYYELVALLQASEKPSEYIGKMVLISLSPQSVKQFTGHSLQSAIDVAQGVYTQEEALQLHIHAAIKTRDQNTFTIFEFDNAKEAMKRKQTV